MDRALDGTLRHGSHHNAAHMGQIVWITKLRRPGSLDDIWRRCRTTEAAATRA